MTTDTTIERSNRAAADASNDASTNRSTRPVRRGGARRRRRRSRARLMLAAAALTAGGATIAPIAVASPAAHAQVASTYATMRCGGGTVAAPMPQVRSTYSGTLVLASAVLYYRSGSQWIPWQSGETAYAYTQRDGWDNQWYFWSSGRGANWWNFRVTPGYEYAVRLTIGDARDGHQTVTWAQWSPGVYSCFA